jgi:hypothetical protein
MASIGTYLVVWGLVATVIFGVCSLVVAVLAFCDNRRQRTKRGQAVLAARAVIERTYGLLIGIKLAAIASPVAGVEAATNNGLSAINEQRETLDGLLQSF